MLILVLTGGLGAGKSTAARYFCRRGAMSIDLDRLAAVVLAPGSALLGRVADEFGAQRILLADGSLDRRALADLAFASRAEAGRLDAIVHPAILAEVDSEIVRLRLASEARSALVLEVPLLVEAPAFAACADCVLAIVAPESVRIARAVERGMGEAEARRRIRVQATDAERAHLADAVIINDGTSDAFVSQLKSFWDVHVVEGSACR